ncbi:MAG: hypothetical protein ACKV2Q_00205 [Planctomycetaceae bacterium]
MCRDNVSLKADGWNVAISATPKTTELTKRLKAEGGFIITHVGKIERDDGSCFSSQEISEFFPCLHYFLSFTLGCWAGVAFPVGFDVDGSRVFEQWGLPMASDGPWNGNYSWFDSHHGEILPQVFPGFVALWKSDLWHTPLTEALYFYLGACSGSVEIGVDSGLILAQTALERIAWTYCVQDRKMVSKEAFKPRGLSAANKLRLLVSSLGIPLSIPSSLPVLSAAPKASPSIKWQDGLDAITGIRNAVVHPDPGTPLPEGSEYEGWLLSLWYIDMILLRLCGHTGKYANRLVPQRWVGTVESVPWA